MKKNIFWLLFTFILGTTLFLPTFAQTQSNDFEIIPKATSQQTVTNAVNTVGSEGGDVRDNYDQKAKELDNVGDQMASGIMTRDTLLDYIVYLVKFLSQIGLVIGVLMIIYAGYLYASSVFDASNMSKGKSAITNAVIWVLVIAFSYAIMKLLTSAFLS